MEKGKVQEENDYSKSGLKAGLEIHQQLDTSKLFCNCSSLLRQDTPSKIIRRKLNPVVGETGEIDAAVLHESKKEKEFVYEFYDSCCLVELDEEPPHAINQEALKIALQVALLLNCKILPASQIMRKIVIDGSNTSGFQRTLLLGYDGFIETSEGKVRIGTLALEEDAARIISQDNKTTIYRLDRLGIPLLEITTEPDLHYPFQIKEAALKIGEILRSCKVKRGIGTIRQDLNISIKGSERVEIKGFQDPRMMIETVEKEIARQKVLVKEKKSIGEVRKANADGSTSFLRPMPGAERMYPETDLEILEIKREMINNAKENLPKLRSELQGYLKELGLNEEIINLILEEEKIEDLKILKEKYDNLNLIGKMLTIFPKDISIKKNKSLEEVYEILNNEILEKILREIDKSITEQDVRLVMEKLVEGKSFEEAIKKENIDLEREVQEIIKEKPNLSINAYMGLLMAKFKGKVSGGEIMQELRRILG